MSPGLRPARETQVGVHRRCPRGCVPHGNVQASPPLILSLAVSEAPEMPPEGGVAEDDRALLEIWLRCWEG